MKLPRRQTVRTPITVLVAAALLAPLPLLASEHAPEHGHGVEREQPPATRDHAPPAARDHAPPATRDHAPATPQREQEAPDVSDSQLSSFVSCYLKVQQIRERYDGPIAEAESPAEAEAIQERAVTEMTEAITDSGLDVDTYNEIAAAIAQNPSVNIRFNRMLEAEQKE